MKVYLIRHGESVANTKGLFSGATDTPLTLLGKKQGSDVSRLLSDVEFDEIYSSPLSRAHDTAMLINNYHNLDIAKVDDLAEMNFGLFEGLTYDEIKSTYPKLTQEWQSNSSGFKFPDGESLSEFYERATKCYVKIVDNSTSDNLLIVAHSGVIRCILANQISESFAHYWKYRVDNCKISIIEYSDGYTILNAHNK